MRLKISYTIVILSFLIFSCKKKELETLPESEGAIKIQLTGTIDGNPVTFEGGNVMYNYTNHSFIGGDSIMKFTGTIANQVNPDNNPYLRIEIKNYIHTTSINQFYDIDSTFQVQVYPWADVFFPNDHEKRVEIIYFDGIDTYSSRLVSQTASTNLFKVLEIGEFVSNENGQPTKKLTIETTCLLSDLISLKNLNLSGTIAFSY